MRVREYKSSDLPHLKKIHSQAGYDFPFPDFSSPYSGHHFVVVNEEDVPIMAAAAKLVPEIFLFCAPGGSMHPQVKMQGIAMIHEALRDSLIVVGHDEAFCFVPPQLKAYMRHLQRKFQWQKTWAAFRIGGKRA